MRAETLHERNDDASFLRIHRILTVISGAQDIERYFPQRYHKHQVGNTRNDELMTLYGRSKSVNSRTQN